MKSAEQARNKPVSLPVEEKSRKPIGLSLGAVRTFAPLLAAIAVLLVLFSLWVPQGRFLTPANLVDLTQQISVNAILAFGLTLVILIGGIDLSVGAVVAAAGVVAVSLLNTTGPLGACAGGIGVAVFFGLANGLFAARTLMPPFIITLATMLIARGFALGFNESRPLPIAEHQELFLALGNARWGGWLPMPVILMFGVFLLSTVLLHGTRFGQHLFAIGGNREAARFTGIAIARHEVLVYAFCGACAGLAGIIHASQLYSAEPAAGMGFELSAIAAVVLGGTSFSGGIGTIPGTLLGAIIIGILDKGLNQAGVHFSLQYIVKGAVILAAVWYDVFRRNRKR
ncbi:MAG: ABC transporter permease [Verrucomicrobiae bacterium]|nr:ABC transporter permease [Verrucomicrobiae bacterium]MDW8309750.1 ABC transporter permease [Verrucomicrobiales bacterium]